MFGNMDIKSLLGGDLEGFAQQMQGGGFDPMAMFQGTSQVHSLFVAVMSPQFEAAKAEFLRSGGGELAALQQQLQEQGVEPSQAQIQSQNILNACQAMLVIVRSNDQGLQPQSHMFFGALDDAYLSHVAATQGEDSEQISGLLQSLRNKMTAQGSMQMQQFYVTLDQQPDDQESADESAQDCAREYWTELAEKLIESLDEGIMPGQHERLSDLAFWIMGSLPACVIANDDDDDLDGDELLLLARCALIAGNLPQATGHLDALLEDYEPEAEQLMPLLEALSHSGMVHACGAEIEQSFATHANAIADICGDIYEIALWRFQLLASAGVGSELLVPAAQRMFDADKGSFRHDLNKEPLWIVRTPPSGKSLDTADAADLLDRSLNFMGKRIDNGTIPSYRDGEDVTIPEVALKAWQEIAQKFKLLD
ncbi:MAG: helix-turn-helix domain-containing protein [Planctomycetes bacterium]|nr:helix-turn-helix domain-containing protein [Planctomycetota bacterium]